MLRHASEINEYAVHASDGPIGTVSDFLFEDTTWLVRWLVVNTGNWLSGREVLLPPSALSHVNHIGHQFNVKLTRQQVKDCPDADTDQPVSRQHEANIYNYYGWSPYWGAGSYMGVAGYGGYLGGSMIAPPALGLMLRETDIDEAQRTKGDPTLRSVKEVTGYHIHARDGEVGHVDDFLVEDDDWSIHYLVVDTKNWWPGNKVLVSPLAVRSIKWTDRLVNLGADRQAVKDSAAYDSSATVDPIYEKNIHKYNGDLRHRERL
jgi:uncharacterized protein YrrD